MDDDLFLLMDMFDGGLCRYLVGERAMRGQRVLALAIEGLRGPGVAS